MALAAILVELQAHEYGRKFMREFRGHKNRAAWSSLKLNIFKAIGPTPIKFWIYALYIQSNIL